MKTRDIVIVMAIFYAIIIPITMILPSSIEEEEKQESEIMMDKTFYKTGEIVEYTGDQFVTRNNAGEIVVLTEGKFIMQNNTGWERDVFSHYKKFQLNDSYGVPLFIIPYQLDVNVIDAKFSSGAYTPVAIHLTFGTPTKEKTMDVLIPNILEPESTDLTIQSIIPHEMVKKVQQVFFLQNFIFP